MRPNSKREILARFHISDDGCIYINSLIVAKPNERNSSGYSLDYYDVDYSKTYGYVFQLSGGGGRMPVEIGGVYWKTPGFTVIEKPSQVCAVGEDGKLDKAGTRYCRALNRTRRFHSLPKKFTGGLQGSRPAGGGDLLDWLQNNAIESDTYYCHQCKDRRPTSDMCGHCWYCETECEYVEGVMCFDPECEDCQQRRREKHEHYWRLRRYRLRTEAFKEKQ